MRIILVLWFLPLFLFWGWYALSAYDISFGFAFLSREVHDVVFQVYANMIGVEASVIPGMIAGACAIDTAIIMGICAFRWRKDWVPQAKTLWGDIRSSYWNDDVRDEELAYEEQRSGRAHPAE